MHSYKLSGKIRNIGCLVGLSVFYVMLVLFPTVCMSPAKMVYMKPAQTAEGIVTGFESVPVQKRGPDGDYYPDYDHYAVVRFQTADGSERTFTSEFKIPSRSNLKEGDHVSVCYNDAWAMLSDDYERNKAAFWKRIRFSALVTIGYILIFVLILIAGKQRKNKEIAADNPAG